MTGDLCGTPGIYWDFSVKIFKYTLLFALILAVGVFVAWPAAIHNYALGFCEGKGMALNEASWDKVFSCEEPITGEIHYYIITHKLGGIL